MNVEQIVRDALACATGTPHERGTSDEFVNDIVSQFSAPSLPLPGQTAAVTVWQPKTAALCYDRVWRPAFWIPPNTPETSADIAFHGTTRFEIELTCFLMVSEL